MPEVGRRPANPNDDRGWETEPARNPPWREQRIAGVDGLEPASHKLSP